MKNKIVAAILAFPFGLFGLHRFYLGQRFLGALYFLSFIIFISNASYYGPEEFVPFFFAPLIVSFMDAILLFVMPKSEFDKRYNTEKKSKRQIRKERHIPVSSKGASPDQVAYEAWLDVKKKGINFFRNFDYEEAIKAFEDALELKYDDASTHFNIACAFSLMEDAPRAFYHLEKAVGFGFNRFDKIQNHEALAYLRSQPEFDQFVNRGYKLPAPQDDLVDDTTDEPPVTERLELNLLEQIQRLGHLREKGILSEEEFAKQKAKILKN